MSSITLLVNHFSVSALVTFSLIQQFFSVPLEELNHATGKMVGPLSLSCLDFERVQTLMYSFDIKKAELGGLTLFVHINLKLT